jgi:protein ImuA
MFSPPFLDRRPAPRLHLGAGLLQSGSFHELRAPEATAGHVAVAAILLAQLPHIVPLLWVSRSGAPYPPGMAWLGLDPARCLFAQARDDAESLGTLETGLRAGMAGVADCVALSRLAARRLALAAKTGGSVGFLLRHAPAFTATDSNAFTTRWLIAPAPRATPAAARLRADLLYAKGGQPAVFFYDIAEVPHGATPPALTLVEPAIIPERQRRTG